MKEKKVTGKNSTVENKESDFLLHTVEFFDYISPLLCELTNFFYLFS
jgi:hypothetical protein